MRSLFAAALLFALALPGRASAQQGPTGRGNYVNIHGELAAWRPGETTIVPAGLYVDWGLFQSQYVATGTRLGISRSDRALGTVFFFGGGPQFHVRLDEHVLLVPQINVGSRISSGGMGFAGYVSLAAAYLGERTYFGLEAETMAFGQSPGWVIFPGNLSVHGLVGFYY